MSRHPNTSLLDISYPVELPNLPRVRILLKVSSNISKPLNNHGDSNDHMIARVEIERCITTSAVK